MATPNIYPRHREEISDDGSISLLELQNTTDTKNGLYYPAFPVTTDCVVESDLSNSHSRVMNDMVVTDYEKRSAAGEVFNNSMDSTIVSLANTPAHAQFAQTMWMCAYDRSDWSQHYVIWKQALIGGMIPFDTLVLGATQPSPLDPSLIEDLNVGRTEDIAVTQAWANIEYSDILALAAIKESRKTVHGLITTVKKVVKIIRAVKKFEYRTLARLLRGSKRTRKRLLSAGGDAQELYMEARYNLRPLYYDIEGLLKLKKEYKPRQTFRGQDSRSDTLQYSEEFTSTQLPTLDANYPVLLNLDKMAEKRVSSRAGVLTELADDSLGNRLGIYSIPETVWELVPFSFIVDWFFNVGDTMLSWMPNPGTNVLSSWVTSETMVTTHDVISVKSIPPGPGRRVPWAYASGGYEQIGSLSPATRTSISAFKTRSASPPRSFIPRFSLNLDSLKIVDLFIILKGLISYR